MKNTLGNTLVSLSSEPVTRGIVEFCGGPRGAFARSPFRVLKAIFSVGWVFLAFAYLSKANCALGTRAEDGSVVLNWSGNRQHTSFCYNDIVPLYGVRGLDKPGFVYAFSWEDNGVTHHMEYPVLAGEFQWVMGWITRHTYGLISWVGLPDVGWYFTVTALVFSIVWVITLSMVAELAGNRAWDSLLVAASPLIIIHAFTNWDIPSIALAVAGLLAIKRGRTAAGGVFFGLGTAFKLWPLFLLGAFVVLAIRNRQWAPLGKLVLSTAVTWVVVNAPVAYLYPAAWGEFFRLNSTRGWEWTTVYAMVSRNFSLNLPIEFINVFSLGAFLVGCLGVGVLGLRVARQPRVAELVYLILVVFLLFNKVWSPQYSLWLLVPAVLALPCWRLILTWGFFDALVWPILMWHMMGVDNKGVPSELLDVAILVRDGFIIAIAVLIIRQMLGKREDKVLRANGQDLLAGKFGKKKEQFGAADAADADSGDVAETDYAETVETAEVREE